MEERSATGEVQESHDDSQEVHPHTTQPQLGTERCDQAGPEGESNKGVTRGLQVPDGGWGWMVAVGSFIVNALAFSLNSCFGILFSGYLLERGTSSTTTAWIYNANLLLWFSTILFAQPLAQEFGQRTVGFGGMLLVSGSMIISMSSPSVQFLYFSFSFLAGVGGGLLTGLSYTVVAPYFDKRRGQANTLVVAGSPTAQMVFAPVVRYLLHEYSHKGAALIYGAILMNILVGVLFFHPLKWHLKRPRHEHPDVPDPASQALASRGKERKERDSKMCTEICDTGTNFKVFGQSDDKASKISFGSLNSMPSAITCDIPIDSVASIQNYIASDYCQRTQNSDKAGVTQRLRMMVVRVARSTWSDLSVLRYFRVLIICMSLMLGQATHYNLSMMLPFAAQAAEHSLQDAAWCLSLMGVCNLVTRLVVSPLSDWNKFNIRYCVILGYLLKTTSLIVLSVWSQLAALIVAAAVYGVGLGLAQGLHIPGLIKFMGMKKMVATNGIVGFSTAFGFPIFGLTIGIIRDATGSYAVSMLVMAAMDLMGSGLWFLMSAAQARDARRDLRQHTEDGKPTRKRERDWRS